VASTTTSFSVSDVHVKGKKIIAVFFKTAISLCKAHATMWYMSKWYPCANIKNILGDSIEKGSRFIGSRSSDAFLNDTVWKRFE
jgi:hypothetical protein